MARPLRIEYPGAVYHVTSRGNAGARIFSDDQDRQNFLAVLEQVVKRYHWLCHAYCLMDNHYHLVIETPEANLSLGMRQLNGIYTQKYNRQHTTHGHVFQGRFKAILVDKDQYLLELCRYVVLNPVRAQMVKTIERWLWSSYATTAGIKRAPAYLTTDWILSLFDSKREIAQRRYREFVRDGLHKESPWKDIQGQVVLGKENFVQRFKAQLLDKEHVKEIPRVQRYVGRPQLEKLFRNNDSRDRRNKLIYTAHVQHGYRLTEIACHLHIHYTTVSKIIAKESG
jgi:REP element-mobilizing transposase RayT